MRRASLAWVGACIVLLAWAQPPMPHLAPGRSTSPSAFGEETQVVPPLTALAIGADADNTGGNSLVLVGDLRA